MENRIKLIAWITEQTEKVSAAILAETQKLMAMDTKVLASLTAELQEWQALLSENAIRAPDLVFGQPPQTHRLDWELLHLPEFPPQTC